MRPGEIARQSRKWRSDAEKARRRREEARQSELAMGQPELILCNSCFGRGCAECRNEGVIESPTLTVDDPGVPVEPPLPCGRCYGKGVLATPEYSHKLCDDCNGTGFQKGA